MFFVYLLECTNKKGKISYYCGQTNSIHRRFSQHLKGDGAKYTKGKNLSLVHIEQFKTRGDAMKRELEIKKLTQKKKIELINNS